jgi:dienelactone hydrolase
MIQTQKMEYRDNETIFEGFCAFDDSHSNKRPVVLVVHDWSGRNEFADEKAKQLAELGYVGFAIDMYGEGKVGQTVEEKQALMNPLVTNRPLLFQRIQAAFEFAKKINHVDPHKTGAIGFCFGGLCVLDLVRHGVNINCAVSFHGALNAPSYFEKKSPITAKILVLHGHDDPMVPPEQVLAFEDEMTQAKADWQVYVYSQTKHAFMNPQANDEKLGIVYNPLTARRSWSAMQSFFTEIFN